ncbi:MAG TPA: transglycosylase domain-containing protein, partial [Ktedonobacteraceae bacterium]|nr:transglycosylase domain-containing protein [Ktedonobacteraceae bacterium]
HPNGWHLRCHLKRKHLRHSNERYAAIERMGTRFLLQLALGVLAAITALASIFVGYTEVVVATQERYQQQVLTLADILPGDSLKMYDMHGTLIYQMLDQGMQTSVPLSQISRNLVNAEVAMEDQYFWTNPGYDITGIVRAALANLTHGRIVSGGSTITQQLIKNAIVGDHDTILRKLQEIILAPEVTRYYSKQDVLAMYLNTIYYGEQAYGADAAAFTYFDLQDTAKASAASQLDLAQAALLAGLPSSPVAYDPFLHPVAAYQRLQAVLTQLYLQGYITIEQRRAALYEAYQPGFLHRGVVHNNLAPHFVDYALDELAKDLNVKRADLARAGLVVSTTLDLPLQNKVFKIAQRHIAELAKAHRMSDAAEVLLDFHTGAIRVLLGNIDPANPQYGSFDVATQGYRQSGSSFKPYIYATAFAEGMSPGMPVMDGPFTIQLCCGLPPYSPQNYDLSFHGLISYRYALQNSFNVPGVKVLTRTGVEAALQTAQAMGIDSYTGTPNYTMVLGTLGIHLLDQTSAYGVFANGGVRVPPHAIDKVTDAQGNLIYQFIPQGKRVLSKQVAFMMTNVLSDNTARTFEFGPCSALYLYSNTQAQCYQGNPGLVRPAAVKTGTSQNFSDNWTIGYTTDYVMGVWAGNNDNSPMINVTGVDGAAPIWHDSLLLAEQGLPTRGFQNPGGLVKRTVDYPVGITTTDWYLTSLPGADWYRWYA